MTPHPRIIVYVIATVIAGGLILLPQRSVSSFAEANKSGIAQDPEGKMVAKLDFAPKPNGFHFKNYGNDANSANDLGPGDLIELFGGEDVCTSGSTAEDCQLSEPAQAWLEEKIKSMGGGHCEGMAV